MKNYKNIFKILPIPCLLLEPKDGYFYIKDANEIYFKIFGKTKVELFGRTIPDAFPENPEQLGTNWKEINESLNRVLISGKSEKIINLRYDLLIPGLNEFEDRYWQVENIPVIDKITGIVNYIIFIVLDKTSEVLEQSRIRELKDELA